MRERIDCKRDSERTIKTLSGSTFSRWHVLDDYILTANGEVKWLCRCDCGTERYVLARSLLSGGSKSCGCLRKERAAAAVFTDLSGKTFGDLKVLHQIENPGKHSGAMWICKCSCGAEYKCLSTLLINGRRTHCIGSVHKNFAYVDITNQKFKSLTALYPLRERSKKGSIVWHCRCDCGNEVDIPYNELVYSNIKSCGCLKKAHDQKLKSFLVHIDGTSLDMIKSRKTPRDNTTGVKGVYLIRGKYVAKIVFQKKAYYLGSFDSIEAATDCRRKAEDLLFGETVDYYKKWQQIASQDPDWADANPVSIHVQKSSTGNLSVSYYPNL